MEIVSRPEISSPEEAGAYVKALRILLRALGTCDGNMEEGSLRCDVNVSVRKPGAALGTRCEIKNVNSVRFVMQAVEYEASRQIEILEDGGSIDQETRLFDAAKGTTRAMRSKENAHDYRYFPDPDLLPLVLEPAFIEKIRATLPELPAVRKARFMEQYQMSRDDALLLSEEATTAAYFEAVAKGRDARLATTWVAVELFAALNTSGTSIEHSPVSPASLGGLLDLIQNGTISGRIAKEVFAEMLHSGQEAAAIVQEKGLVQVSDSAAIDALVQEVLAKNADKVAEYKSGKEKLFGFFVGQVMAASRGKANPGMVNDILKKALQ
jgi:aspartyl-tRNA(Asn)/glutamyl-tRNA(Gln) amidotransferase subunit B